MSVTGLLVHGWRAKTLAPVGMVAGLPAAGAERESACPQSQMDRLDVFGDNTVKIKSATQHMDKDQDFIISNTSMVV